MCCKFENAKKYFTKGILKMKKIISLVLAVILALSSMICVFAADEGIKVYLEGSKINFDVQPQTINDRTMVPIRAIFETMGANVTWDETTQTATSTKDNTTVKMTLNSTTEYINDIAYEMDVTPVIIDGRTLAPARYVAEAFGYYVNWDSMTQSVLISKNVNFDISQVKDGTREHPYKLGDKVSITFWDPWDYNAMSSLGTYEFTLKSIMSPSDMEKKFNDSYYSHDSERWYLNANVSLLSYNKNDVCSFQDMMYDSKIVTSDFVPGTYYSWYVEPSDFRFVELYSGGSTECYIPLQKDEIAEGQTADYFTITYYSDKDVKETIWFSLK